jgi:hypothetical protein
MKTVAFWLSGEYCLPSKNPARAGNDDDRNRRANVVSDQERKGCSPEREVNQIAARRSAIP